MIVKIIFQRYSFEKIEGLKNIRKIVNGYTSSYVLCGKIKSFQNMKKHLNWNKIENGKLFGFGSNAHGI